MALMGNGSIHFLLLLLFRESVQMKILFVRLFDSYFDEAIKRAFKKLEIEYDERLFYTPADFNADDKLTSLVREEIKKSKRDFIFSVNYWPHIAKAAHEEGIKYVSWSYDCPLNIVGTPEMEHDTNEIFLFDRAQVKGYKKKGIATVHHFPLAADVGWWDTFRKKKKKEYEVSFIGNLYESTLPGLLSQMSEYDRGYINGLIESQQRLLGYYFLDEVVDEKIVTSINASYEKSKVAKGTILNREKLLYSMSTYLTYLDRISLLSLISGRADTYFVTGNISEPQKKILRNVKIMPPVSYDTKMPDIFKSSKINLCPILRIIGTGIPLRALDIMGCGGLLLANVQEELMEYFSPMEEFVPYDSYGDAVEKAVFFIKNDTQREKIAAKGHEKVRERFNFADRLKELIGMVHT